MLVTPMRPAGPSVKSAKVTHKMQRKTNGLFVSFTGDPFFYRIGVVSPSNPHTAEHRRRVRGRNSGMQTRVSVRSANKLMLANTASCLAPSYRLA